jgi:hypothetical protein
MKPRSKEKLKYDSRVNAPSFQVERVEMRRLFLAILWLNESSYEDRLALYLKHRYHGLMVYMRQHRGKSADSPIHSALTALVGPKVTLTRLYISAHPAEPPSHCITIALDPETGRWHTHAYNPTVVAPKPKPGIFLAFSPIVDAALSAPPPLKRVFGPNPVATAVMRKVLDTHEARRMASHCYIVGQCVGALYRGAKLAVHFGTGGCVTFTVDTSSNDGYVFPFDIAPYSDSPTGRAVSKPRVVFWGDAESDGWIAEPMDQYILPAIRPDLILDEVRDPDPDVEVDLLQLCKYIVIAGLSPFIQIVREGAAGTLTVDTVVPHYIPSNALERRRYADYVPVVISKGTRYLHDSIPKLHIEGRAVRPSSALMRLFGTHLQTQETPYAAKRGEMIYMSLSIFRCESHEDASALFKEHKVRLSSLASTRLSDMPWRY